MDKRKDRCLIYLLSFIIPVTLLLFVFYLHHIFPFGDKTVMTGDLEYQFTDYLAYLKTIVFGNNDFSYSFSKNLGGSMAGFSAYYYYSPLNYLTLLFPNELLPAAEALVILLTAGFSSLTMSILLVSEMKGDFRSIAFAIAYALCGFSATYFQLIMYSGNLILFPLIILGFLRLLKDPGRRWLYLITLTLGMIFNYYSAYMICIFLSLLFICSVIAGRAGRKEAGAFIISSVEAALMSAFTLFPAVRSLTGEKNSLSLGIYRTFSLRLLPRQFFAASFKGDISSGLPNVFCGTLTLILFLLFLINRKFPLRERLIAAFLCLFLIGNFWINILNTAWHGFNQPIGFPYRYSYMLSFVLILCAHKEFVEKEPGGRGYRAIFILLTCIQAAELSFNYYDAMKYFNLASMSEYREYLKDTGERLDFCVDDAEEKPGDGIYRLEKYFRRTNNDAMMFDYAGLSHFSSSEKKDKINFLGKLGFRNNGNWSFYNESTTDFLESFLGIRYILSQFRTTPNFYKRLVKAQDISVFRNENALPLMFNTTEEIRDINYNGYNGDPFLLQEAIAHSLNGRDNHIFEEAKVLSVETENLKARKEGDYTWYEKEDKDKEAKVTITLNVKDHDSNLFAYFDAPEIEKAEIFRRKVSFGEYFSRYRWNIVSFHRTKKKEKVDITIVPGEDTLTLGKLCFYYEDRDNVKKLMDEVKTEPSYLRKITSSHLAGGITVPEDGGTVTLTIPYDKGWSIFVDGKKTENKRAAGILLSFDASPGEHEIEMKYLPEGAAAGRIVSAVTLLLLIFGAVYKKSKKI